MEMTALLPVLLNSRGAQAGQPMAIDRILPGEEFLDRQGIAAASFLERQQAATHGRNDFGLATDHPALCTGRREVRNRERATVGPDDILDPRAMGLCHGSPPPLD